MDDVGVQGLGLGGGSDGAGMLKRLSHHHHAAVMSTAAAAACCVGFWFGLFVCFGGGDARAAAGVRNVCRARFQL